ncbi:hypothetical protein EIP91_011345 [Steccherinum ochraceum]|uniref:DUF6535 domain-containing protein n=1 Tax=Steccherinum ochraceum TaxID=92696 RepID=A0A4R0QZS4_9APHY|nr:hypothetical protein EIP91_011345 [Steccherinum ochraceum]
MARPDLSPPNGDTPGTTQTALSLVFSSIILSLDLGASALRAKAWLSKYETTNDEYFTPKMQGLDRQKKYRALQQSKVILYLEILPIALEILVVVLILAFPIYLWNVDVTVSKVAIVVACLVVAFEVHITLSSLSLDSPSHTPLSQFLNLTWHQITLLPYYISSVFNSLKCRVQAFVHIWILYVQFLRTWSTSLFKPWTQSAQGSELEEGIDGERGVDQQPAPQVPAAENGREDGRGLQVVGGQNGIRLQNELPLDHTQLHTASAITRVLKASADPKDHEAALNLIAHPTFCWLSPGIRVSASTLTVLLKRVDYYGRLQQEQFPEKARALTNIGRVFLHGYWEERKLHPGRLLMWDRDEGAIFLRDHPQLIRNLQNIQTTDADTAYALGILVLTLKRPPLDSWLPRYVKKWIPGRLATKTLRLPTGEMQRESRDSIQAYYDEILLYLTQESMHPQYWTPAIKPYPCSVLQVLLDRASMLDGGQDWDLILVEAKSHICRSLRDVADTIHGNPNRDWWAEPPVRSFGLASKLGIRNGLNTEVAGHLIQLHRQFRCYLGHPTFESLLDIDVLRDYSGDNIELRMDALQEGLQVSLPTTSETSQNQYIKHQITSGSEDPHFAQTAVRRMNSLIQLVDQWLARNPINIDTAQQLVIAITICVELPPESSIFKSHIHDAAEFEPEASSTTPQRQH